MLLRNNSQLGFLAVPGTICVVTHRVESMLPKKADHVRQNELIEQLILITWFEDVF